MKKLPLLLIIICLPIMTLSQTDPAEYPGFIDKDNDGINDVFRDANGDGINDVNNQEYEHDFQFEDNDGDGINDIFQDQDGDGVNDLSTKYIDRNGDGSNDNVIDVNGDWINDVTGIIYNKRSARGTRFGFILEELGQRIENYKDTDGDGHFDREPGKSFGRGLGRQKGRGRGKGFDKFIDEDGDGIADGKGFRKHNGFPWDEVGPENRGRGKGKNENRGRGRGRGNNQGNQEGRQ